MQWLGSYVDYHSDASILIVYENGKIPRFARETGLDMATDVLTICAFLKLAERRGIMSSAEDVWQRIVDVTPTANPPIATISIRNPRQDMIPDNRLASGHRMEVSPDDVIRRILSSCLDRMITNLGRMIRTTPPIRQNC